MEDVATIRRAALAAVEDVEPTRLRERIHERLANASLAPGVLTLASARAVSDPAPEGVDERGAGVQLIYEGLRLTRTLAHDAAWTGDGRADANIDILLADILVARGFYLLAHTEAAGAAVQVVRDFGRDQTVRRETGDASLDHSLEADVLELAVVAGTTAAGGTAPADLRDYAATLVNGDLPAVDHLATDDVAEELATLASADSPASEGVQPAGDL